MSWDAETSLFMQQICMKWNLIIGSWNTPSWYFSQRFHTFKQLNLKVFPKTENYSTIHLPSNLYQWWLTSHYKKLTPYIIYTHTSGVNMLWAERMVGHRIKVERAYPHTCISRRGGNSYHHRRHGLLLWICSIGGKEWQEQPCKACNSSTCSHNGEALTPTPFYFAATISHCNLTLLPQLQNLNYTIK